MKEVMGINHVGIRVTDLEQARKFYEQLGFIFIAGPIGIRHLLLRLEARVRMA